MFSIYTSESVCAGHPDKIADQISDSVLDAALAIDPLSRVAVETMVGKDICVLMGEVTSKAKLDYEKIARKEIRRLGYTKKEYGFWDKSRVELFIHEQSPEIAQGVDDEGAGDQGLMFGYATTDTKELMPISIQMAHHLAEKIDQVRESKVLPYLRPDGKTQVSISYKNGKPHTIETIIIAVPHSEKVQLEQVKQDVYKKVVLPVIKKYDVGFKNLTYIVNGTGVWHKGGPASDTGLTGRKIVVDTYGGIARIGGGTSLES
jgi:S-adenosylmethionine synthetase